MSRSRRPRSATAARSARPEDRRAPFAEHEPARAALRQGFADAARLAVPANLPIAERAEEVMAAIRDHQVVVVAGETGSGKSTQLPKLCLALGRGITGMIGHTQPRRVAARTIAARVADEIGTTVGAGVGFAVRFTDTVGPTTLVKVMTDGILLAEIQRDRMLRRYDTIIVDEAHERSLNVDFLLGYLKQLLPRRPDLKVIITSATIDTARFAEHFGGAPVIEVSGRTYPVDIRYRPPEEPRPDGRTETRSDGVDVIQSVVDAVDELAAEGPGDVLVFFSGEREIHDAADVLRRRGDTVLPLYARLSSVEQHRIFEPHQGRRIVLATNIAETSITVPGVRYVVDTGMARISRYSHRLKVQRLPIEPVSQASANQRAGRCGRVAPGVCIRLYAEDDLAARPAFTEPEILRTNLASVILQMTALGLGDIAAFPFVEAPDRRSIRDGYALLEELGAIEPADTRAGPVDAAPRRLTPIGRRLARLPIDPRLGRMVLAAEQHGCVREVLVIAAALSIQDPREVPAEQRQAAEEAHRRFAVPGSDLLGYVRLWDHLRAQQQAMSSSQFRRMCRAEFLNYLRVREWQDLYSQLRQIAGQLGIRGGADEAHPDRVHQALMAGLLSHLGMRDGDSREFRGAHGSKFAIGGGSVLAKKLPKWVMAAELMETNRLWGRRVAAVQPEWAERIAGPLVRYSYGEPQWNAQQGRATVIERATLYGLPIVSGRSIGLDRIDPDEARDLFIRHALVDGDVDEAWAERQTWLDDNRRTLDDLRTMGDRLRRFELLDDDLVHAFYAARIGPDVVSTRHFDRWWRDERQRRPQLLTITAAALFGDDAAAEVDDRFPDVWRYDDLELRVTYRYEPGAPDDGVTVHVPLTVLDRVGPEGFDWSVPGIREELVSALCRTLPKEVRRAMVPAAETVRAVCDVLVDDGYPLVHTVARVLDTMLDERVTARMFDPDRVPDHLRVTFSVDDETGRPLAAGKDIRALQRAMRGRQRAAVAAAVPFAERTGITTWDLGAIPPRVEARRDGYTVVGHPALLDDGDSVSLRVFTTPATQMAAMRGGVRRLLLLTVPVGRKALERGLDNQARLAFAASERVSLDETLDECLMAAADRLVSDHLEQKGTLPFEAEAFAGLQADARQRLAPTAGDLARTAAAIVRNANEIETELDRLIAPSVAATVADARAHLDRLVRRHLVRRAGWARLADVERYVRGIARRLERLPADPLRDQRRLRHVGALDERYGRLLERLGRDRIGSEHVELGWMLEEVRLAEFAPGAGGSAGRTGVSVQRVTAELARLGG